MKRIFTETIEQCNSSKISVRKKGVQGLSELMTNPEAVEILNRASASDNVNWNEVFAAAHRSLLLESENWMKDEAKETTASRVSMRENLKMNMSSLVSTVLKKANKLQTNVKFDLVSKACFEIFADQYLQKNFGVFYLNLLRENVLPVREYRSAFQSDDWDLLFDHLLKFLKHKKQEAKNWEKHCILEVLEKVVLYGCSQSQLGIRVKNKLLPLLETEFVTLNESVSIEDALLSLTLCVCSTVAKESRTGVCHLGEMILSYVIRMYDPKSDATSSRSKLILDFLYLQVKCHHPKGEKQEMGAAYACNWNVWNRHLCSMYRLVWSVMSKKDDTFGNYIYSDTFWSLCIELCNQLFDNNSSSLDFSLPVNESAMGSAPKRRRCTIGLEAIFDELQKGRKNASCGIWIELMSRILLKCPLLLKNEDLHKLLEILIDLHCISRHPQTIACICKCFEQLLEVMGARKVPTDLWLKVWETTLRSVGLNQSESHPLLRALVCKKIVSEAGLESLCRMFLSQMIQFSDESVRTLMTLLSVYTLPESSDSGVSALTAAPWEQPLSTARVLLIEWLCSGSQNFQVDPELLAKVLVLLIAKTKYTPLRESLCPSRNEVLKESSVEDVYISSAFEDALILSNEPLFQPNLEENWNHILSNFVDKTSLERLELLLRERSLEFESRQIELQDMLPSQGNSTTAILKTKLELTCEIAQHTCLIANVLSYMIQFGAISNESFDACCVHNVLLSEMKLLITLIPEVLKPSSHQTGKECVFNSEKVCEVLKSLLHLFKSNLLERVSLLLRANTTQEIILPVVVLFEMFPVDIEPQDQTNNLTMVPETLLESILSNIVDVGLLTDVERIHFYCLGILINYGCPKQDSTLITKQTQVVSRIFKTLTDGEIYDMSRLSTFAMSFQTILAVSALKQLDREKHVIPIIELLQAVCRKWSKDADVSCYILFLLKELFKNTTTINNFSKIIFSRLRSRNFGPKFSIQLISCFEVLFMVDKNLSMARWKNASNFRQIVDSEDIPAEALRKFEDEDGNVAMIEEVIVFLLSPFHEVRLAAVSIATSLLTSQQHSSLWQKTIFERLRVILYDLFITKDEDMSREEKIDESANRTATVLHILAAIIARSATCYKQGLLLAFRLFKEKDLNIGLLRKVFDLLAEPLKLKTLTPFLSRLLGFILNEWLQWGYQLQDFPFQVLNVTSFSEFCKNFKETILSTIFKMREPKPLLELVCKEIGCSMSQGFEASFASIFAQYLPVLASRESKADNTRSSERQYLPFVETFSESKIKQLALLNIVEILVKTTKLVWDSSHHEILLGLKPESVQPSLPTISHEDFLSILKYLQKIVDADSDLLVFLGNQRPLVLQKVLLQLREDIFTSVTADQRILSLHQYCAFAHVVAICMEKGQINNVSEFMLSDMTHTLIFVIKANESVPEMRDVCIGSCSYLKVMYEHLLPNNATAIGRFLHTIVGCLIPLTHESGALGEKSLMLLNLLIVTNQACLGDAISQLPPFPKSVVFEEMSRIHCELKYGKNLFTLEDEIRHFLRFARSATTFANQDSIYDGLHFLKEQLSTKKAELSKLYQLLEVIRGSAEDCKESVLHQLLCSLVDLTSSTHSKVQLEASRCLGEIGPSNLTTLVLRPAEGSFDIVKSFLTPFMCVMGLAAHFLSEYLLEQDVDVVIAASKALYSLLSCKGAESLYHDTEKSKAILNFWKISPFIQKRNPTSASAVNLDSNQIINMLCQDDIWCPSEEVHHKEWITSLACALLTSLSDNDSYFRDLIDVCKVKTSFAEEMLPVLFYLGLTQSSDVCYQLCTRLAQFFDNHCSIVLSEKNSQVSSSLFESANIYLDRASVQCMLNVVNFVRLQKSNLRDEQVSLKSINYLHIASAAQFCSAYFSSIMYLELWCNHENRPSDFDGGLGVAFVDYICEVCPEDGDKLQSLLREAYNQIGDHDALYGCGSAVVFNPNTRVNQYECVGMWDKVLLNYDLQLSSSKNVKAAKGFVHALQRSGLFHMLETFLRSLPSDQKELLHQAQVECMWRLGHWGTAFSTVPMESEFEWKKYSALHAFRDRNYSVTEKYIAEGRLNVLSRLKHASLESSNNIYLPLAQLRGLQEIEDSVLRDDFNKVIEKWKAQDDLPFKDIFLTETILAQRAKIIESVISHKSVDDKILLQTQTQLYLDTAKMARKENQSQIAEQWLHFLSKLPHLTVEDRNQLQLEEAQLAWSCAKSDVDVATNSVARQLLGFLLKELHVQEKDLRRKSTLHSEALILYGKWMAETQSENPQQVIENYLEKALLFLDSVHSSKSTSLKLQAHDCLAHFADLEYQRITSYINSEAFQNKVNCMEVLHNEGKKLQEDGEKEDDKESVDLKRAARLNLRCAVIDSEEIKHTKEDQNHYMQLALRHYLLSLQLGEADSMPVFRMISLWLENTNHDTVNNLVSSSLDTIQTHKFIMLLPQLAARMGNNMKNTFTKTLHELLKRCCLEHPHHSLPLILALANSYEDRDLKVKPKPEARVLGAKLMLSELKKSQAVCDILSEMETLASALISLAYLGIPGQKNKVCPSFTVPRDQKVLQLRNLHNAMLPIISLPVQSNCKYDQIIGIHSFENKYYIAGGITRPKRILCRGSDGINRPLLVKGKDDLRQDAVMQQVFNIMNTLLKACQETNCRKLSIRTYKIVPLSRKSGVLEWCQNTEPLQVVLPAVHSKFYPKDWDSAKCRKVIETARPKSNAVRIQTFKQVCSNFHPAFRFFFTDRFPNPAEWFDNRLAYVHSVATSSMVGFILGLGDRHVSNILIDKKTAELIHIDFGIALEQGRLLPTPETVPFRLTRDIVDAMGVSGVEGVFRRSCEKTMMVLRKNQEKILTILEVLLYDPLCDWIVTPRKAANRQREQSSNTSISSESESEGTGGKDVGKQKNKMAERALSRLQKKLQGTEEGPATSIEGQVNRLIQQARDPANLALLFGGWQAYY